MVGLVIKTRGKGTFLSIIKHHFLQWRTTKNYFIIFCYLYALYSHESRFKRYARVYSPKPFSCHITGLAKSHPRRNQCYEFLVYYPDVPYTSVCIGTHMHRYTGVSVCVHTDTHTQTYKCYTHSLLCVLFT